MIRPDVVVTDRELEMLKHAGEGLSNKEIAERVGLKSQQGVKNCLLRLYRKLNAKNRAHAVKLARDRGLI